MGLLVFLILLALVEGLAGMTTPPLTVRVAKAGLALVLVGEAAPLVLLVVAVEVVPGALAGMVV